MTKVTVREIRQNGGPVNDRFYCGPQIKLYVIRVDGRRYDSRLTKRQAMAAAKKLANGAPVVFEPCTLMKYGYKPDVAQQEAHLTSFGWEQRYDYPHHEISRPHEHPRRAHLLQRTRSALAGVRQL